MSTQIFQRNRAAHHSPDIYSSAFFCILFSWKAQTKTASLCVSVSLCAPFFPPLADLTQSHRATEKRLKHVEEDLSI